MNRSRVLRRERAGSIYRLAFVASASRLGSARRGVARRAGSMVNEKSVSRDNRVQRSDNAYIIVGVLSYTWAEEACESCFADAQRRRNLITYNEYIHYVVIPFIH